MVRRQKIRSAHGSCSLLKPSNTTTHCSWCNVHVQKFFEEVELTKVQGRIGVDQNASIIEEKHSAQDKASAVNKGIGTTGWGVGPAIEERVRRTAELAKDIPELKLYLADQVREVNDGLDEGKKVLLEGTQGFMLSLFLSGGYPYVTGRDTAHQLSLQKQELDQQELTTFLLFTNRL